jgi:hypothetical protein
MVVIFPGQLLMCVIQARYERTRKSEFNDKIETVIYKSEIQEIAAKDYPQIRFASPKVSFIDGLIYDGTMSLNWFGKQITIDMPKKQMIVGR